MVTIEFDFNQKIIKIQGKLDEPFKNIVDKYFLKNSIEPNSVYFLANGKILNLEQTIESQMTEINKKNKKLTVLVNYIMKEKKYNEDVIIKSKDIICPKCHEPCRIKIQNSKIKLFGCINNHIIDDIKFTNFNETQKINISEIICNNCKIKNLGNCPNNEFYCCLSCIINLCLLCKPNHNQNHNIIKYTQKHYICQKHNEIFDEYCEMCNMNICFSCEEHEKHKTISFKELKPNLIKTKLHFSEIKAEIDVFNNKVKEIIEILNNLVKIINVYCEINYDIINNYEFKNRNYQNFKNLEEINNNNDLLEKLKKVNQIDNIKDKIINIININELYCRDNSINNGYIQKMKSELELNLQNDKLENQKKIIGNKVNPPKFNTKENSLDNNKNNIPMKKMYFNTPNKNMNQFQIINSNLTKNRFNVDNTSNPVILKPIKRTRPLDLYTKPTLIGLQNIGAPSFINAILQCLSHTEDLTNYFLDEELSFDRIINNNVAIKNKNDLQLSPVYLELLKNLWNKNNIRSYYEPKKLMETIVQMNPLFKKENHCETKDFILFFLEQLHEELQKTKENKNYNNITYYDPYDRNKALINFLDEFMNQASIISDIFICIKESNGICLNCKNNLSSQGKTYPISYNYFLYYFLIFPLEEVKKYRNYHIVQNNSLTLKDCFLYDQRIELNQCYCNICKKMNDQNYISKIYSASNVLILILKQGKNGLNIKLDFKETIDITDFVSQKKSKIIYNLYGVISEYREIGSSSKNFLAFCKSPICNKWYSYKDAVVNEVKNFKKEVIDFGEPNILFYKLQN